MARVAQADDSDNLTVKRVLGTADPDRIRGDRRQRAFMYSIVGPLWKLSSKHQDSPAQHTVPPGWIHVGTTQGRGRYDTKNQYALPKKHIWLCPTPQRLEANPQPLIPIHNHHKPNACENTDFRRNRSHHNRTLTINGHAANWHRTQTHAAAVTVCHRSIAWLRNWRNVLREIRGVGR